MGFKEKLKNYLLINSLLSSRKEMALDNIAEKLKTVMPNLQDQVNFHVDYNEYLETKRRNLQVFQIDFTIKAIEKFCLNRNLDKIDVIDIGDSSGNHLLQIKELTSKVGNIASVNLDQKAVEKISNKGIKHTIVVQKSY